MVDPTLGENVDPGVFSRGVERRGGKVIEVVGAVGKCACREGVGFEGSEVSRWRLRERL